MLNEKEKSKPHHAEVNKAQPRRPVVRAENPRPQSAAVNWREALAKAYIGAIIFLAVLVLGAFVLFSSGTDASFSGETSLQPLLETPSRSTELVSRPAASPPAPAVAKAPALPEGLVTVPEVGLRSNHSMSSKGIPGKLKRGERVAILKRHSTYSGPSWVQVRTKSGKVGWVFASVIREPRSKTRNSI
jgi:hypothetical protein